MAIRVTCPSCESSYTVDDAMRGKKVRCRDCEATVAVPSTSGKDGKSSSSGAGKKQESISSRPMPRVAARASDRDRDDDDRPRRKDPAKKSGMLLPLVIGGGVLAVLGVLGVIAVVVIFFVLGSSSPAPVAKANAPAAAEAIAPPAIAPPPIAPPPPAQVAPPPVVVAPAMEGSIPLAVL
jgi:predicted Zn finger-like uncharacterized protein